MIYAKVGYAITVTFGPVLNADGTMSNGALAYTDAKIFKNGADGALNASATFTHKYEGHYALYLTASDISAVGEVTVVLNKNPLSASMKSIIVLAAQVYDSLMGTDLLQTDMTGLLNVTLTETSAGYLAAAFKKFLDVATPVLTAACVNQGADSNTILTALNNVKPAYAPDVASTGEVGLDFSNIKAAANPTTLTNIIVPTVTTLTGHTAQSVDNNVILSKFGFDGTGPYYVKSSLTAILGTLLTETGGYIAGAFKKFFNVQTPTLMADTTVQVGCDAALVAQKLDHLVAVADADDVADNSIVAKLAATAGNWSDYVPSTDSLQSVRDKLPTNLEDLAVTDTTGLVGTAATQHVIVDSGTVTAIPTVVLATSQPNYAPAKAGDQMDLVNAPNTTAIAAFKTGLAGLGTYVTGILATALTETTSGWIAVAFKKFFNIETPALTVASKDQTGDTFAQLPPNLIHLAITDNDGKVTVGTNADKDGYKISGTKQTLDALQDAPALTQRSEPPTAASVAALVLATPANKLVTDTSGHVSISGTKQTLDSLQDAPALTQRSEPPTAAAVAALVLATPANKLVTDVSGHVSIAGTKQTLDALNDAPTLTQRSEPPTAASVAALVLATPANKLVTDGSGHVSIAGTKQTLDALNDAPALVQRGEPPSAATIAAEVWGYTTRTLTSFGTAVADVASSVWVAATRTLTTFAFTPTPSNEADTTEILNAISSVGGVAGPGADQCTLTITVDGSPAADADVWISSNASGSIVVAGTLQTNSEGKVRFMLDDGCTYYLWAQKDGMNSIMGQVFVAEKDA